MGPLFTAASTADSNHGHAFGSRSRFDVSALSGLGFFAFAFGVFVMAKIYSSTPVKLKQARLTIKVLTSIGRLVRACAELDDILTLYICSLAEVSESHGAILLGRTPVSKKVEIAQYLAKMRGKIITEVHGNLFNTRYDEAIECRNVVAHGVFRGKGEDGRLYFRTSKSDEPIGKAAGKRVYGYTPNTINAIAISAEKLVPIFEKTLMLSALREKRLQQPVGAHPKGLSQSRRTSTPKPPRRSLQK